MDVTVKSVPDRNEWSLTDLLGRSMGVVRKRDTGDFLIEPDGNTRATMTGMRCGPFPSLDDALTAIETHTRGVCRRETETDRPEYSETGGDAAGTAGIAAGKSGKPRAPK